MRKVRRALISVSDKDGLDGFARSLHDRGVIIISTGGTARAIRSAGIPVTDVADVTRFPEMMDGRLKTLHPKSHGGLLGRDEDDEVMHEHDIKPIDLLVVNLYPFGAVTAMGVDLEEAVENIDIGGPAMLRGAAKNWRYVGAVVDTADYERVLQDMDRHGGCLSPRLRYDLMQKVFAHTADYDAIVAAYLEHHRPVFAEELA